jgi:hypothetical protein
VGSLTLRDNETRSILVTPQHFPRGEPARAQHSGLRRRGRHRSARSRRPRPPPNSASSAPRWTRSQDGPTSHRRTAPGSAPRDAAALAGPIGSPERASNRPGQRDGLHAGEAALDAVNVRRSFRWPRQAIGRQGLADRSTDPSAAGAREVATGWLTRAFFVGDTGYEPVTFSVSGQNLCSGMRASVASGACEGSLMSATVRVLWPTVWPTVNRLAL